MKNLVILIMAAVLLFGCASKETPKQAGQDKEGTQMATSSAATVKKGDVVRVDYVGTLDNGTVFDTSVKAEAQGAKLPLRPSYEPLEFTVGAGEMIKGFDEGIVGMKEGEEKTINMAPKDAYGDVDSRFVITVNKSQIGGNVSIGSQLSASGGQQGTVTKIDNITVTVDFNHPLAGKPLTFRVTLRKIVK